MAPIEKYSLKPSFTQGKVVPVLNWAPRHEDVWGTGGTVPRIINLDTR
jgi:hypothetical protein